MEKPGGRQLQDFEQLIATMRDTGKVFHTGYMYRYNPFVIDLLERVHRGELGQILSVEAQMNCIHPRQLRQWLGELPGGMMFYLGCHLVDLILQLQGKPLRILPLNKSTHCNTDAKDFGMAVFEYENGISFAKTTALEIGGYARRQLVVNGTLGTVELKPFEMYIPNVGHYTEKTEYTEKAWNNQGEHFKTPIFNRYDGMMAGFASFVRGEKENPYTLDYELELYKTLLQCCAENQ
jgi:predicted dehydrogenase